MRCHSMSCMTGTSASARAEGTAVAKVSATASKSTARSTA